MGTPSSPVDDPVLTDILLALRQRSMDGYTLLSKIGLKEGQLVEALRKLGSIVTVKGELREEKIGEAYLSILPSALGVVDRMLAALRFKQGF